MTENELEEIRLLFARSQWQREVRRERWDAERSEVDSDLCDTRFHDQASEEISKAARVLAHNLGIEDSHEREPLSPPWWVAILRKVRERNPDFSLPVDIIPEASRGFWGILLLEDNPDEKHADGRPFFSERPR